MYEVGMDRKYYGVSEPWVEAVRTHAGSPLRAVASARAAPPVARRVRSRQPTRRAALAAR